MSYAWKGARRALSACLAGVAAWLMDAGAQAAAGAWVPAREASADWAESESAVLVERGTAAMALLPQSSSVSSAGTKLVDW